MVVMSNTITKMVLVSIKSVHCCQTSNIGRKNVFEMRGLEMFFFEVEVL